MNDLSDQLINYSAIDNTEAKSILLEHGTKAVVEELERLLNSKDIEIVQFAAFFIKDAHTFGGDLKKKFRQAIRSPAIWKTVDQLLLAPHFLQRQCAINLIDWASSCRKHGLLEDAFPWFLKNDPINLPGVIFTIEWVSSRRSWKYYDAAATADHYLSRWSLCQVMDQCKSRRHFKYLDLLRKDPHPLIAAEASTLLEETTVWMNRKLSEDERQKELEQIESTAPEFRWFDAHVGFTHTWWEMKTKDGAEDFNPSNWKLKKTDYTVEEFDSYVREEMKKIKMPTWLAPT